MFNYSIAAGNPEGLDFDFTYQHEIEFSQADFKAICEEAFCFAMEKQILTHKYAFITGCGDGIHEYMLSKGFIGAVFTASYYLEPYWGKDTIKSQKLLAWVNHDSGTDIPDYFKTKQV